MRTMASEWPTRKQIEQEYSVKVLIYDPNVTYLRVEAGHERRYEIEITRTQHSTYVFKVIGLDTPGLACGDGYYAEHSIFDTALRNVVEFDQSYERDPSGALGIWGADGHWQRQAAKVGWHEHIRLLR